MLYYLGELIAAQNYSPKPYMPMTLVTTSEGRRLVPLFEIRRGIAAPGEAAVHVYDKWPRLAGVLDLGERERAKAASVLPPRVSRRW
jgi:hypothetical protein